MRIGLKLLSNSKLTAGILVAGGVCALSGVAHAGTVYDAALADPPGFYNGSGNPNAGFVVETSNGIELGLGVNLRFIGPVTPTSTNVYDVPLGFSSGTASKWNFEYSVNLGGSGLTLGDVTPTITVLNQANAQSITFDPLVWTPDNSGWDGTSTHQNGALATDIGFQNSENLSFAFVALLNPLFAFDPNANNSYIVTLSLLDVLGNDLGSVSETINATPIPAALPLFASGVGVVGFLRERGKISVPIYRSRARCRKGGD